MSALEKARARLKELEGPPKGNTPSPTDKQMQRSDATALALKTLQKELPGQAFGELSGALKVPPHDASASKGGEEKSTFLEQLAPEGTFGKPKLSLEKLFSAATREVAKQTKVFRDEQDFFYKMKLGLKAATGEEFDQRFKFYHQFTKNLLKHGFAAANLCASEFVQRCHRGESSLDKPHEPELVQAVLFKYQVKSSVSAVKGRGRATNAGGENPKKTLKHCKWHGKNTTHVTKDCKNPGEQK